ncbi:hypothetical protein K501DRAFT_155224, partial [Backusella circina FSU 941]
QMPCNVQMVIALNRLGSSGTGVAYRSVARRYSISEGEVLTIMKRFIKVILSMHKDYIKWPKDGKKKLIIEEHRERSGFTGCIGFVDGSLLSLHEKPFFEPQSFYNRKKQYMISSTMVRSYDLKILYAQVGDFGSIHHARAI